MSSTEDLKLRVPTKLRERLDQMATATGRSRDWLIRRALKRFMDENEEDVAETLEGIRAADAGDLVSGEEVGRLIKQWAAEHRLLEEQTGFHDDR